MHVFRLRVRRASRVQTDSIFDCAQLRIQRRGKSERALSDAHIFKIDNGYLTIEDLEGNRVF